jgi:hypothetical protein
MSPLLVLGGDFKAVSRFIGSVVDGYAVDFETVLRRRLAEAIDLLGPRDFPNFVLDPE